MTIEQKQVKAKTVLKEVVAESAEKLEQVSKEAQQKVTEVVAVVTESAEKL